MDKSPGVPKNIPLIGGKKEQPQIQPHELIPAIVAQLKPTLDIILENVTALEGRMAVVEEVKQLFPAKIEVTVKTVESGSKLDVDSLSFEDAVKRAGYESVDVYLMQHGYKKENK